MRRLLLLTVGFVLAAPHIALAGTVSIGLVTTDPKYGYEQPELYFTAAPGERNDIVVARTGTIGEAIYVLRDTGAPVTTTNAACTALDANTVSCVADNVFVDAGDGDDSVTLPAADAGRGGYVRGGDGNDRLTGGGFLAGGAGNDVLTCPAACGVGVLAGGAGDDALHGGDGNDILSGDGDGPASPIGFKTQITETSPPGDDTIDGGGGTDLLTFQGRDMNVKVDLAAGSATGPGGERDRFTGIENAAGGDGDDFLLGDAGANRLEGGPGDDRIDGRAGDDYLLGNVVPDDNEYSVGYTAPDPGADTLHGGAGDDTLDAGSERGDELSGGPGDDTLLDDLGDGTRAHVLRCGSGRDTIAFKPQGQLLPDCELLALGANRDRLTLRPQRRAGGRLRFVWQCHEYGGCAMTIGVRVGATAFSRRTLTLARTHKLAFLVAPRRAPRRGAIAEIAVVDKAPYAGATVAHWRVRLL